MKPSDMRITSQKENVLFFFNGGLLPVSLLVYAQTNQSYCKFGANFLGPNFHLCFLKFFLHLGLPVVEKMTNMRYARLLRSQTVKKIGCYESQLTKLCMAFGSHNVVIKTKNRWMLDID